MTEIATTNKPRSRLGLTDVMVARICGDCEGSPASMEGGSIPLES